MLITGHARCRTSTDAGPLCCMHRQLFMGGTRSRQLLRKRPLPMHMHASTVADQIWSRPALKCGNSKSSTSTVRRGRGLDWSSNVSTSASRLAAWASDGLFHNQYIPFGTLRSCNAFMMPANLLQHAQPAPHENIESGSACRQVLIPPVVVAMACTIMCLEGSLEGSIGLLACWRGSSWRCP